MKKLKFDVKWMTLFAAVILQIILGSIAIGGIRQKVESQEQIDKMLYKEIYLLRNSQNGTNKRLDETNRHLSRIAGYIDAQNGIKK